MFEGSAVATCGVLTNCDTECIAADVNDTGVQDPTFNVRVVTKDNGISFVTLGDTIFIIALEDSRVFAALDDSLFISPLGNPTFSVAPDDFTNVAGLNGVTLSTAVLWPTKNV